MLGCGIYYIEDEDILIINGKGAMPGECLLIHRIHTHLLYLNGIPSDGYTVILERELEMHIALNAFCWYCCHIYISY